jgi:hypothetical protein
MLADLRAVHTCSYSIQLGPVFQGDTSALLMPGFRKRYSPAEAHAVPTAAKDGALIAPKFSGMPI